jgi:hypothetical protein
MRPSLFALACAACVAGCYDFSELGPGTADRGVPSDAGPPSGGGDDGDVVADLAIACVGLDDCPTGYNCIDKVCRPAVVGCAAHKTAWPSAGDGVYWIAPAGSPPRLAYCDMSLRTELCTTAQATHTGKTREGSNTAFSMTSALSADGRICDVWAVRGSDGFPLGVWAKGYNSLMLSQCQALGFVDDVAISQCPYGSDAGYSNCGYAVSPLYAYGHQCLGTCQIGGGTFTQYTKMGPFTTGAVLSTVDGAIRARCRAR